MLLKKKLLYTYFAIRTSWPIWWYVLNRKPRRLFSKNIPTLNSLQQKIIADLTHDGISSVTLDELFPEEKILEKLQHIAETQKPQETPQTKKTFLREYWETKEVFDIKNPFLELSLRPTILNVVNSYMKMWTTLRSYSLNQTIPVGDSPEIYSQQWHRDPEEKRMIKMFIYLNDVDESTGPFMYIPQTVYGSKYGNIFPQKSPEGSYPKKEDLFQKINKADIRTMTGKAGTVIICDTTGLHRGGHATKNMRIMFTAFYSAPSFRHLTSYIPPEKNTEFHALPQEAQYALSVN